MQNGLWGTTKKYYSKIVNSNLQNLITKSFHSDKRLSTEEPHENKYYTYCSQQANNFYNLISQLRIFFRANKFIAISHVYDFHPVPHVFKRVECRPDVKKCKLILVIDFPTVIIINNIAHFFSTSINNPVMSIKWQFVSEKK